MSRMSRIWTLSILILIFYVFKISLAAISAMVQIKNGTLEGTIMKSRKGREFASFRGIPYALPPVGELRFKAPRPFEAWTGVRSAKEDGNVCPQRDDVNNPENVIGIEDCLYLNVYTPKLSDNGGRSGNYSVMIFLHGGGWVTFSGNSKFHHPQFLLDHDIVLVVVNYRLGVLGFLSTEDMVSSGNQGLKDQAQSIRWVHENIAAFGGDPNSVTIFGGSAGGASVHFHMISPLSKGIFHRAISQSGNAYCLWALSQPGVARSHANRLGKHLHCPIDDSLKLVECLKEKDPVDLVTADRIFEIFGTCPRIPFRPVVEPDHLGAFLIEEPVQSVKSGKIIDVPWMIGFNSHEGALKVASIYGEKDKGRAELLDKKFMEIAPISLLYDHTCLDELVNNVTASIREFYLSNRMIDETTRMDLVDMYTDAWFYSATDNAVRDHHAALSSPIYYYYFSYKGRFSMSAVFGDAERDYGVTHGDEVQYLFPTRDLFAPGVPLNEEEHQMVDVMTRLVVNFAKFGNPTPGKTAEIPVEWTPVKTSSLEYFHIDGPQSLNMGAELFPERINFWSSIPLRSKVQIDRPASRTKNEL